MAVEAVKIEADAYMVCLTHALTTEREEVMGLLIGEVFLVIWYIFRACYVPYKNHDKFLQINLIPKELLLRSDGHEDYTIWLYCKLKEPKYIFAV